MTARITTELLVRDDSTKKTKTWDVASHVHHRVERFLYNERIVEGAAPIAYVENPQLDSRRNLLVTNRTYGVKANGPSQAVVEDTYDEFSGQGYTTPYKELLVTNQSFVDEDGNTRPLFWKHQLPSGVEDVEIRKVTESDTVLTDTGYREDLDNNYIYTNYQNFYDPSTHEYELYFVVASDQSGNQQISLLDPQPVAHEATWEDIDLDTGALKTGYPTFSKERTPGGYSLYFSIEDRYWIKPLESSLIQPLRPRFHLPENPWFLRISNGDITTAVNGERRRYWVPEYHSQPFIPHKPYLFMPAGEFWVVTPRVLKSRHSPLAIDPQGGLHLELRVYDADGEVTRVFTTDESKDGDRFDNTGVFYESGQITSWDNQGGYIETGFDVLDSWEVEGRYYYEAEDYEYTGLSLNPLDNPELRNHMVVIYLIPDVNSQDHGIHHLLVDTDGRVVETTQGPDGIAYGNLQLFDSTGSYNPDTIVGGTYRKFLDDYAAGGSNNLGYMVIAECSVADHSLVENQEVVDLRRVSALEVGTPEFETAIANNPKILQSVLGYGPDGQVVPKNHVVVVQAGLELLEDYGGNLQEQQVRELLEEGLPSGVYMIIDWVHPAVDLQVVSTTATQVDLEWSWEGPNLTYRVYRWENNIGDRTLIHTDVDPAEGTGVLTHTDTGLTGGETYFYGVAIEDTSSSIEFPIKVKKQVKVR